jgi:hypothetical protein
MLLDYRPLHDYVCATSMELTLHGRPVQTVFDLLGKKENDLTFSLGWALANVPTFTTALMDDVMGPECGAVQSILLQERDANGITDIEIFTPKSSPDY